MFFTIPFAIWKAKDWSSEASSAPSRLGEPAREAAWTLEDSFESNTTSKRNKKTVI